MNTLKASLLGTRTKKHKVCTLATLIVCGALLSDISLSADQSTQSWLMSNNAASFTYTGNQGLTTGTVFTLSTAGNYLGFCTLKPQSGSTPLQYSTSCFSNYGTPLGNGDSYSAVAFLGTTNNPNASFIVGDSAGNLSIATPDFGPNYQVTGLNMTSLPGCPSGNSVANLQTDPSGNYVYIGCYNPVANPISVLDPNNKNVYTLPGYTLYSATITVGKSSIIIGVYSQQGGGAGDIFSVAGNSTQVTNQVAAVWPGVSTVMKTYPPGYPGLQGNNNYSSTGAVLVSGMVNSVNGVSGTASTGPLGISNAAFLCSNGTCSGANFTGGNPGDASQIITAFEIGMDNYGSGLVPAIYTSSFIGSNSLWYCSDPNPVTGGCEGYEGTIYWKDVSPTITSCSIYYYVTYEGVYCANSSGSSQNLIWPPNGMPKPGGGYQIDITNLTYVPTPANNPSAFTQGLLMIGTWTNGYLSYHSPANPNASTGIFLNQENGGNIGNVNSITADTNGNLLFQTGSQGLYAMNPFVGTNTATGTDSTLIQQPADSSSGSGPGWSTILANGAEFVYYTVSTIAKFAVVASTAQPKLTSIKVDDAVPAQSIQDGLTPRFSLVGPFNIKKYHGQFVFTPSQLQSMGLNPGEAIQGLRFRNAEGLKASPIEDLKMNKLKVTLSEGPSDPANIELKPSFSANFGKNRKTVKNGPLNLYKDGLPSTAVHPDQSIGTGIYGQLIPFRKEYKYKGGNLLVDIDSSGKAYSFPVTVDAFGTKFAQGLYQTPKTKRPVKLSSVPAISFVK